MFLFCLYCVHGKSAFPIQFEDLGLLENLTLGDGSEAEEVRPESHNAFHCTNFGSYFKMDAK